MYCAHLPTSVDIMYTFHITVRSASSRRIKTLSYLLRERVLIVAFSLWYCCPFVTYPLAGIGRLLVPKTIYWYLRQLVL